MKRNKLATAELQSLRALQNNLAMVSFGRTKETAHKDQVCIQCGKPPVFYSDAGRREYRISGLCEPCFDSIFSE